MHRSSFVVALLMTVGCSEYDVRDDLDGRIGLEETTTAPDQGSTPGGEEWDGGEDPSYPSGGGDGALRPPDSGDDGGDGDDSDDGGDDPLDPNTPDEPGTNEDPCRTIGYWQNHEHLWPVEELILGDRTYTASEADALLSMGGEDASVKLGRQLIATELNMLVGGPSDIAPVADAAHDWIAEHDDGSGLPFGIPSDWPEGQEAEALAVQLDQYNNQDCPDGDPATEGAQLTSGASPVDVEPAAGCSTTGAAPWAGAWVALLALVGRRRR